jgi:hypothetical protein
VCCWDKQPLGHHGVAGSAPAHPVHFFWGFVVVMVLMLMNLLVQVPWVVAYVSQYHNQIVCGKGALVTMLCDNPKDMCCQCLLYLVYLLYAEGWTFCFLSGQHVNALAGVTL